MSASNYKLLPGESIILHCEEVGLVLTNLNFVEVKSKGLFNPTYTYNRFPISKIKESNGKAQVILEENWIHIHFTGGKRSFELYNDKEAVQWVNAINKLVTGVDVDIIQRDNKDIFADAVSESKDTGKAMGEAVLGAIPLPGTKFIGRTVGGIVGGVVGGSVKGVSEIIKSNKQSATPIEANTQIDNKCRFCGAPIPGSVGQAVRCRYCDADQHL